MRTEIVASVVEGGQSITLRKRGDVYDVLLGATTPHVSAVSSSRRASSVVLLSSAALETEYAFGCLASSRTPQPRTVVIGGLGFGATLRGVIDSAPDAEIVVVERFEAIAQFLRGPLAPLSGGALEHPRVSLVFADVVDVIARSRNVDLLLLDVDNGPNWASLRSNARLYADSGLAQIKAALSPGGAFAVWSGYASDAFVATVRKAGLRPEVVPLRERGTVRARAYLGSAT